MSYRIRKEFSFSASHRLPRLPEHHPCHRLHGHNYVVTLEMRHGDLDANGFVLDYRELDRFKAWLDTTLDHRHLNDVFGDLTTAENLSRLIYEQWSGPLPQLVAVQVSETPKTWAEYRDSEKEAWNP